MFLFIQPVRQSAANELPYHRARQLSGLPGRSLIEPNQTHQADAYTPPPAKTESSWAQKEGNQRTNRGVGKVPSCAQGEPRAEARRRERKCDPKGQIPGGFVFFYSFTGPRLAIGHTRMCTRT